MSVRPPALDAAPAGFAVLRTPLLPFDELEAWSAGLEAPAAVEAAGGGEELGQALGRDRERLRERLRALVERPEVREALFLASPSLDDGLERWRREPDGKKGRRAEEALVRYLLRMSARPTPFGLFSGCSLVELAEETRLELPSRAGYARRSRLDMDYVFRLEEELGRDPAIRRALAWRPSSSLYRAAGRLRYAEAQLRGGTRSYHLVAVDPDLYLETVLAAARGGATVDDLVGVLVAAGAEGEIGTDEAAAFVDELIDNQLLVSDLAPLLTGADAVEDLLAVLRRSAASPEVVGRLAGVAAALDRLDRAGVGNPPDAYRALAGELAALPATVELPRLFQVDMTKPAPRAVLGAEVVAELARGVALLARLAARGSGEDLLGRFRRDFADRYGRDREVPLLETLDEESGVGFDRDRGADVSPLLDGLELPAAEADPRVPWGAFEQRLTARLGETLAAGAAVLELGDADFADLGDDDGPPLSDGFEVMATVAAASPTALSRGDFRVLLRGVYGPSGARLAARFCHAEPALAGRVRELLRAEEALEPDAVFAEIVHLPEGRIGNIVARPLLREREIPFLGRSGAPAERQIPLADLTVAVSGERVVLRSAATGQRVLPRLTNAHNFAARGLGVYRFLGALQAQGVRAGLFWRWGPLEAFPHLPRVTCGRLVLARARWALSGGEIAALDRGDAAARYAAVAAWRRRCGVPRWVVLPEGDNELVVDLDNPLAVDAFLGSLRGLRRAAVVELFPGPGELCAAGPEGRFTHEVVVPFVRRREPTHDAPRRPAAASVAVGRSFPPGSEWLFAKLYTGTATADRVLREVVSRVVPPALASGAADGWFFLRYGDPDWHLRLRLHGRPERLWGETLPALEAAVAPLLADGRVWKMELGTYEREVERYGGPVGVVLAERLFQADSEAVVAVLDLLEGDASADVVWRLALAGLDRLLVDFGLEGEAALGVLASMQAAFAREHRADGGLKKRMSDRLRREQAELERLLDAGDDPGHPFAPALAAFRRRSQAMAPVIAELAAEITAGRVGLSLAELAPSHAHMFVNRMLRSQARAHELVLYDFLLRLAQSRRMRRLAVTAAPRCAANGGR